MPPVASPRVHVVVVTFNSREHVLRCLDSLTATAALTVTVLDNASSDGTADLLAGRPGIALVRNPVNVGFARAVNVAARRVDAELLLLLNPDCVLRPDTVDQLLAEAAADPSAGIWGGRALHEDGTLDPSSCLPLPRLWHAGAFALGISDHRLPRWNPDSLGGWRRDDRREVPALTGAVLLVDQALWQRLGGFDERYFVYGEDVDLCARARRDGARPVFTPAAVYVHAGGASSSPGGRLVALLAGRVTLAQEHLPRWSAAVSQLLLLLGVAGRALPRVDRAQRWREAWERRSEWRRGWP
jgi:GT2 family glycosyltransferase